jgi:GYF domain 2/Domain of unknown function (DUF4234)
LDYFISRDGQQYGPYTLADLQRYVASGEVLVTDLATSDALTEPVAVAQIVGNISASPVPSQGGPVSMVSMYPDPPNLHWGLVLLFTVITCGIFSLVWEIVQAVWIKRVEPESKSAYIYGGAVVALLGIVGASVLHGLSPAQVNFTPILQIVYYALVLVARYSLRSSLEEHYNGPEPMGLDLSGVMTFFFGGIYFQYHINDIVRRKAADRVWEVTR